jgi:Multiubiquitin
METHASNETESRAGHEIVVNGRSVEIAGHNQTGRQVLADAGCEPVEDFVLIEAAKLGSRLISLDETITLRAGEVHRFFAFRTGEVFTFTVDEHGFQWGRKKITEPELREIAHVVPDDVLVLERGHNEPRILHTDDYVELSAPGTEHLRTERRFVEVFLDNVPKEIPRGVYTTEELMAVLKVPPGYLLNLAEKDGLKTLKPGERIHVREGMRFFTQVPGGGAS